MDGALFWSIFLVLRLFGRGSGAGQGQLLPMLYPRPPGRYYKVTHYWLLPVLGPEALREATVPLEAGCHQPRPGATLQEPQESSRQAIACLEPANLGEFLGKVVALAEDGCPWVTATE